MTGTAQPVMLFSVDVMGCLGFSCSIRAIINVNISTMVLMAFAAHHPSYCATPDLGASLSPQIQDLRRFWYLQQGARWLPEGMLAS